VIMIIGGIIALFFGVAAEGKSLEDVADPLGAVRRGEAMSGAAAGD